MNADLTFNTIVFKKNFDNEVESRRSSVARGVNTPDVLTIKSQQYTDSKTKISGVRHTASIDRIDIDGNLMQAIPRAYVTLVVPSNAISANVDTVVATFKAMVADASFLANVLNNEK